MRSVYIIIIIIVSTIYSIAQPTDKEIMNAFKQGNVKVKNGGNCVSIALIKAGYSKYGYDLIKIKRQGTNLQIYFTNKDSVIITEKELKVAREEAAFKQNYQSKFAQDFKVYAELCFAAMAKKLQIEKKYKTYDEAIIDLNDGFSTEKSFKLLGLDFEKLKYHNIACLTTKRHLVVDNAVHAVYASRGFYDESSSRSGMVRLNNLRWKQSGIKCLHIFCGIDGAYQIK